MFLLRVVDLNLMSADADPAKLVTQFVTIFATISFFCTIPALFGLMGGSRLSLTAGWTAEHFFIETTMTVAGLVAVLNWDSAFPDRQDVLVIAPLPVRKSTLLLAKTAALIASPGLAIGALNLFAGFAWPVLFRGGDGLMWVLRTWPAYWATACLASGFVVFAILALQGLIANVLPRQLFMKLSAFLQAGTLCLLLSVYFLGPSLESPAALVARENQRMLHWLPSYWFLGLFQQLNGSLDGLAYPAMAPLVRLAWKGLAVAGSGAFGAMLLAYFRMMPLIIEQGEINAGRNSGWMIPRFGNSLKRAVTMFSLRTLLRSRQHRMVLSFYLGIGMTILVGYIKLPFGRHAVDGSGMSIAFLLAGLLMMMLVLLALRVVATIPISLQSNWIMRVTQVRAARAYQDAVRVCWIVMGVVPVMLVIAGLLLAGQYRFGLSIEHFGLMLLLGLLVVEVCLYSFPKIPYTCSYLPGKAKIHFVFWAALMLVIRALYELAKFEERLLADWPGCVATICGLAGIVGALRWWTVERAKETQEILFEEEYPVEIITLRID